MGIVVLPFWMYSEGAAARRESVRRRCLDPGGTARVRGPIPLARHLMPPRPLLLWPRVGQTHDEGKAKAVHAAEKDMLRLGNALLPTKPAGLPATAILTSRFVYSSCRIINEPHAQTEPQSTVR